MSYECTRRSPQDPPCGPVHTTRSSASEGKTTPFAAARLSHAGGASKRVLGQLSSCGSGRRPQDTAHSSLAGKTGHTPIGAESGVTEGRANVEGRGEEQVGSGGETERRASWVATPRQSETLRRCQEINYRIGVGRIGNPSRKSGRIANPSYSQIGNLIFDRSLETARFVDGGVHVVGHCPQCRLNAADGPVSVTVVQQPVPLCGVRGKQEV